MPKKKTASKLAPLFWAACFLVPIAMLCALSCARGVYPFGSESFLTEDLKYQYIDFFTWYRRVLLGQESIFYSMAQGLGCNTWGLYSYYLASPFNLLVVSFDTEHLTLAVFCIVALKLGCMQLSAAWYLLRRFGLKRVWAFAIALGYTWSLWSATNLRNPLWLDALVLLPLLLYGVWLLVRYGRWKPLCASMAVNVICCWYTAYMCTLFLVLAAILEWWALGRRCGMPMPAKTAGPVNLVRVSILRLAARFARPSCAALLLSAWTLLPTIMAMSTSDASAGTGFADVAGSILAQDSLKAAFEAARCVSVRNLAKGLVPVFWDASDTVPQLWCGIFLYVCAGAFLASRHVSRRTKIAWLAVAAVVLSGIVFSPVQAIWCGFRSPNGFYSRVAMLVAPTLLWAAGCALQRPRALQRSQKGTALPNRTALSILSARLRPLKTPATAALPVLIAADLLLGACFAWGQVYTGCEQAEQDTYAAQSACQVADLKASDPSFWRFERTYTRADASALNEGLAAGYSGISSYSSAHNSSAIDFLNALGYSEPGEVFTRYAHPILASDALLGVKYVSTQGSSAGLSRVDGVFGLGDGVHENPYALGLGYIVSADADNARLVGDNPFERQNSLASALAGHEVRLFEKLNAQVLPAVDGSKAWSVNVADGCLGYAYVDAVDDERLVLDIDGAFELENWIWQHALVPFGETGNAAGSAHIVHISAETEGGILDGSASCLFYKLDLDALQALVDELSAHQVDFSSMGASMGGFGISSTVEATENGWALISIPHEKGWTVRVNGEPGDTTGAFDGACTLVRVEKGTSNIEMSFMSPGFAPGCAVSILTLLMWGAAAFACQKRQARRANEKRLHTGRRRAG